MVAVRVNPKDRMGHVHQLVGIERHVDVGQFPAVLADECGEPADVAVGTAYEQRALGVAEVDLRIDDEEMGFHGLDWLVS